MVIFVTLLYLSVLLITYRSVNLVKITVVSEFYLSVCISRLTFYLIIFRALYLLNQTSIEIICEYLLFFKIMFLLFEEGA